jgi:hypothetical protein
LAFPVSNRKGCAVAIRVFNLHTGQIRFFDYVEPLLARCDGVKGSVAIPLGAIVL